jgi:oxidase EvaA
MRPTEADLADSFLESSLTPDSPVLPLAQFRDWFRAQRERPPMTVREIPFAEMDQWEVGGDPCSITHRSGKFFAVQGLRVETDFGPVRAWEQPIVLQPEVGILGVITRMIGGVRHLSPPGQERARQSQRSATRADRRRAGVGM